MSPAPTLKAASCRSTAPVPLALARIGFGLTLLWDIVEVFGQAQFWFPGESLARLGLVVWGVGALGLALGAYTRASALIVYVGCVYFLGTEAMARGFEYHLDPLYLALSLGWIFVPANTVLSLDKRLGREVQSLPRIADTYLALVLGWLYFDSALWKLSSSLWWNGLGYWTPASQPWAGVMSFPWTLESRPLSLTAGYVTLVYELSFLALIWFRKLRVPLILIGLVLHIGIALTIPLQRFGVLMVVLLIGLWPAEAPRTEARRPRLALPFLAAWIALSCLASVDPILAWKKHGFGGLTGSPPRAWHVDDDSAAAMLAKRSLVWGYRLTGARTHSIFLDSQFAPVTAETRLRVKGEPIMAPLRHRLWVAYNYRLVYPPLSREVAEGQLERFLAAFVQDHSQVTIEQRPLHLPVEGWEPGVRAANQAAEWREVGHWQADTGVTWTATPVWNP